MSGNNHHITSPNVSLDISKKDLQKITHDLNNIINNVINGLDLVNEYLGSNSKSLEVITKVKNNALLASQIINQLTSNNSSNTYKENISLHNVVSNTLSLIGKNQKYFYTNNSSNDKISGNTTELSRIIINVVKNAEEADVNSIINITLNQSVVNSDEFVELVIEDNGPGISKENIKNIFSEGYSTKTGSNQGLGLAIVKEMVDLNFGIISVESEIGKRTTFKILFPTIKKMKLNKIYTDKTILIAEDNLFQLEVLRDLLGSLKIKTLSASNGKEVLNLLENNIVDLLIIDKTMPVMDGIECIHQIKARQINIPIVLTSGSNIESFKNSGQVTEILIKPYSFDMVQNILSRLI